MASVSAPDFFALHRAKMNDVFYDLQLATHCHSCGKEFLVCLRGYTGMYCSKACWRDNEMLDAGCPVYGGCKFCESCPVSLAHSTYHADFYKARAGGYYWPMCDIHVPCENWCILNKKPMPW